MQVGIRANRYSPRTLTFNPSLMSSEYSLLHYFIAKNDRYHIVVLHRRTSLALRSYL